MSILCVTYTCRCTNCIITDSLASGGVGLTFACSSTQGAGLVLPDGAKYYDANNPAQSTGTQRNTPNIGTSISMVRRAGRCVMAAYTSSLDATNVIHGKRHAFILLGVALYSPLLEWPRLEEHSPIVGRFKQDLLIVFTGGTRRILIKRFFSVDIRYLCERNRRFTSNCSQRSQLDTVIGGSKAKGPLIVSPVPYGVESPFRRGIPVGEMDTYGESVGVMLYHPSFSGDA